MARRILVLHGPNLNLLGEGTLKGLDRLTDLNAGLRTRARAVGVEVKLVQSNHEGALVDALHAERAWAEAVIVSPAVLARSGYVLRDALVALGIPAIEVQLTEVPRRVADRGTSVFEDVCADTVSGRGLDPYLAALERLADRPNAPAATATKTLGRRRTAPEAVPAVRPAREGKGAKSIGRNPAGAERARPQPGPAAKPADPSAVTRGQVRDRIAARLAGRISAQDLAAWAREKWLAVDRGAARPAERDALEDALQRLAVSATGAARLSDHALVELMARLE